MPTMTASPQEDIKQEMIERAILAILWDSRSPNTLLGQINMEWFLSFWGKNILEKTKSLLAEGLSLGAITAQAKLDNKDFEKLYLSWQEEQMPKEWQLETYLKLLGERYANYKIKILAKELTEKQDVTALEKIRKVILETQTKQLRPKKLDNVAFDAITALEQDQAKSVYFSGFPSLDEATLGFRPGELYTIGARPGVGKTSLCCQLALNIASKGHAVLILTIEMTSEDIVSFKILPMHMDIDVSDFRSAMIKSKLAKLKNGFGALAKKEIYLLDHPAPSLENLRMAIDCVKPQVVMIDYLQIMKAPKAETRRLEIVALVTGLKAICKEYAVAMILLAQLNRETDKRPGAPLMADLLESGAIEAISDVVFLMWEDTPKNEDEIRKRNELPYKPIKARVSKNRHGIRANFELALSKRTAAITELGNQFSMRATQETEVLDAKDFSF